MRWSLLPVLLCVTLFAVAACSGNGSEETTTSLAAATTQATDTTATTTTEAPTTTTTAPASTSTAVTEAEAAALTIMPIGDSITSGETGWSTYRCYLDGMLNDAGVSFDFVGSKSALTVGNRTGVPPSSIRITKGGGATAPTR